MAIVASSDTTSMLVSSMSSSTLYHPTMASIYHTQPHTRPLSQHMLPHPVSSLTQYQSPAHTYQSLAIPYHIPSYATPMQFMSNVQQPSPYYMTQTPYNTYSSAVPSSSYITPQQHLLNQYHSMMMQQQRQQSTAPTVLGTTPQPQHGAQHVYADNMTGKSDCGIRSPKKRRHSDNVDTVKSDMYDIEISNAQSLSSLVAAASMSDSTLSHVIQRSLSSDSALQPSHHKRIHKVPRRRNHELPEGERWYCPYSCGKWYRNTSSISRTNHIKRCTKVPKAIQQAAFAEAKKTVSDDEQSA